MEVVPKITAELIFNKLKMEGVMLLPEVRDAGGHAASRSLDAMSFGLWPSKGSHATGYEIKVSRQDWLKELSQIEKAEAFRPYCKYFYLAAAKKVAEVHEIPETWGFIEFDGRRLVTVKPAPANENLLPFPSTMLSAILKRCEDFSVSNANFQAHKEYEKRNTQIDKLVEDGIEKAMQRNKDKYEVAQKFLVALNIEGRYSSWSMDNFIKDNEIIIGILKDFLSLEKNFSVSYLSRQAEIIVENLQKLDDKKQAAINLLEGLKNYEKSLAKD